MLLCMEPRLFNVPNLSHVPLAHVDEKMCCCGGCVEVCPAGPLNWVRNYLEGQFPTQLRIFQMISSGRHGWNYKNNNRIECHDTGTAPCKDLPVSAYSVQGAAMAAEGRYRMRELIKKKIHFPAVYGRVCNKRCEAACTRTIDQAVAIDDVKKFIAQKILRQNIALFEPVIPSNRGRFNQKIMILGGPTGLSLCILPGRTRLQARCF